LIYNIKATTSIVIEVELPFNGNPNNFYDELYKNRITHRFIRNELELPEDVRIKLNGTFTRDLYYLDSESNIRKIMFKIQTAAWMNAERGKWQYVSIFPCFIKKHCPSSLHLLENASSRTGKGENVLDHIDDPEELFNIEDPIVKPLARFEKEFKISNPSALLNSKYIEIHNQPIQLDANSITPRRFPKVYELILTAKVFFGIKTGVLCLVNTIVRL